MSEPIFILNLNDGMDTLHRSAGLTERCNTDQIEGRETVDTASADAMVARGIARLCQHCNPQEDPS